MKVVAPHDGLLVMERGWRGGRLDRQAVWPGQKIGEIPDLGARGQGLRPRGHAGGLAPDALRVTSRKAGQNCTPSLARRRRGEDEGLALPDNTSRRSSFEDRLRRDEAGPGGARPHPPQGAEAAIAIPGRRSSGTARGCLSSAARAEAGRVTSAGWPLARRHAKIEAGDRIALRDRRGPRRRSSTGKRGRRSGEGGSGAEVGQVWTSARRSRAGSEACAPTLRSVLTMLGMSSASAP